MAAYQLKNLVAINHTSKIITYDLSQFFTIYDVDKRLRRMEIFMK